jgi:AcrR family transcriptional regulator
MSPRTQRQFEVIREQKKKLIMETALHLFASDGYYNTSISDIAAKAGISKGLLYNYFASKEELIGQIVDGVIEEIMDVFDPNQDGKLTHDELVFFLDAIFTLIQRRIDYWKLYFALLLQPEVLKIAVAKFREVSGPVTRILASYFQTTGVEDPYMQAILFSSLLDGVALNYVMSPNDYPVDNIKKMIRQLFIK